jgi:DNA uptake protein ComE-like DNA-binding protein
MEVLMRMLTALVAALCCALCTTVLGAANDPPPGSPSAPAAKAPRIDLNTAGLDVLMALEGITPERAKAIVENRENRCYESAAELIDRKILPKAAYDRIKDKVKVGPCAQSDPPAAATDTGKRGK